MIHLHVADIAAVLGVQVVVARGALLDDVADDGIAHHCKENLRRNLVGLAADDKMVALMADKHKRGIAALKGIEPLLHVVEYLLDFFLFHNSSCYVLHIPFLLIATDDDGMVALVDGDASLPRADAANAIVGDTCLLQQSA